MHMLRTLPASLIPRYVPDIPPHLPLDGVFSPQASTGTPPPPMQTLMLTTGLVAVPSSLVWGLDPVLRRFCETWVKRAALRLGRCSPVPGSMPLLVAHLLSRAVGVGLIGGAVDIAAREGANKLGYVTAGSNLASNELARNAAATVPTTLLFARSWLMSLPPVGVNLAHMLGKAGAARFNAATQVTASIAGAVGAAALLIHLDGIENSMLTKAGGAPDNNRDLNDEEGSLSLKRAGASLSIKIGQVTTSAGIQELMRAVIAANGKLSSCAASLVGFLILRNMVNIKAQDTKMAVLQRDSNAFTPDALTPEPPENF
jgi:hypothetical protein